MAEAARKMSNQERKEWSQRVHRVAFLARLYEVGEDESTWPEEFKKAAEALKDDKEFDAAQEVASDILMLARENCQFCKGKGVFEKNDEISPCGCVIYAAEQRDAEERRDAMKRKAEAESDPNVKATERRKRLEQATAEFDVATQKRNDACRSFDDRLEALRASHAENLCRLDLLKAEHREIETAIEDERKRWGLLEQEGKALNQQGEIQARMLREISVKAEREWDRFASIEERREYLIGGSTSMACDLADTLDALVAKAEEASASRDKIQDLLEKKTVLEDKIKAIFSTLKPVFDELSSIEGERARIAKHHEPKIRKAEDKIRRLKYLLGEQKEDK